MPNPQYVKGRRKEYEVCKQLREEGFDIVQRTAGSHSPVDIIAIKRKGRIIRFVQCKSDNLLETQKQAILLHNHWLNNMFEVEFVVI